MLLEDGTILLWKIYCVPLVLIAPVELVWGAGGFDRSRMILCWSAARNSSCNSRFFCFNSLFSLVNLSI